MGEKKEKERKGGVKLPFLVKCHNCGYILFQGDDKDFERILFRTHGARYRWRMSLPDFVACHHNYKCPNCGARLHTKPVSIAIKPWNGDEKNE